MNTNAALDVRDMHTTPWRRFVDHGTQFRICATYGWHKIGQQEPYWSVTGEIQALRGNRWREDSMGSIHDSIAKHFPELASAIKWHLSNLTTGPMHYVENAVYWYEKHLGVSKYPDKDDHEKALNHFRSTVVYGAVEEIAIPLPSLEGYSPSNARAAIRIAISAWCDFRLAALLAAMKQETDAIMAFTIGDPQ